MISNKVIREDIQKCVEYLDEKLYSIKEQQKKLLAQKEENILSF